MTLQQFQSGIARTYKPSNPACHGLGIAGEASEVLELILAVTGINITDMTEAQRTQCRAAFTAAGRVSDIVKKELFHKTGVNLLTSERRDDMRKELGDVLWYVAAVASDWGFTLDEVAQGNIDKLAKRYPNGFEKGGGKREPRELDSDDVMLFAGQPFDPTGPPKVIIGGINRSINAADCLFKQALGWRCTRGVHSVGDPCTLVSVPVSDAEVTTARAIRLPKQTFRAIRNQFRHVDRSIDIQMYPGRQTMCVCASVFEEGDE